MKINKIIFASFILTFLITPLITAQDLNVHYMIGEKQSVVTQKYGNPVHQDNSSPEMMCMFYQTKTSRLIFVANKEGVYQSEATASYDSETSARKDITDLISGSLSKGFEVDSVSTSDFHLHKHGLRIDVRMTENKLSKKYEVSVKANKSEE
jgi:hypothetical protein